MAEPTLIQGGAMRLYQYRPATTNPVAPSGSDRLCSVLDFQIQIAQNVNTKFLRDCNNATLPGNAVRTFTGREMTLTASGDLDEAEIARLNGYWDDAVTIPLIMIGHRGKSNNVTEFKPLIYVGDFLCTSFQISGNAETEATVALTLVNDGAFANVTGSADLPATIYETFAGI